MKKLFNTIQFAKHIRKNIIVLDAYLDGANSFGQLCEISRQIREYQRLIRIRMNAKPSFICRIELRELRNQLRKLRRRIAKKTVNILNNSEMKAA